MVLYLVKAVVMQGSTNEINGAIGSLDLPEVRPVLDQHCEVLSASALEALDANQFWSRTMETSPCRSDHEYGNYNLSSVDQLPNGDVVAVLKAPADCSIRKRNRDLVYVLGAVQNHRGVFDPKVVVASCPRRLDPNELILLSCAILDKSICFGNEVCVKSV